MKKSAQYAKQIKQLATMLKKEKGKAGLPPLDNPMEALLLGILSAHASEQRAEAALARLLDAVVDLNEVRVSSIAELVTHLGTDFPSVRPAAEEISRALSAVFNRTHRLNLEHLKTGSRKAAETFLDLLDGVGAHAKAVVVQRCLGGHVVPIDRHMLFFLQRNGCVPENATVEEAQKLLAGRITERDAAGFYVALKRHAAAHTPRKLPPPKPAPAPVPQPPEVPAEKLEKVEPKERNAADAKSTATKRAERPAVSVEAPRKPKAEENNREMTHPAGEVGPKMTEKPRKAATRKKD